MIHSEDLNELFSSLSSFQAEYVSVKKDASVKVQTKTGGSYSFKYLTLDSIVESAKPGLEKHGLAVTQLLGDKTVTTILAHKSGQFIGETTTLTAPERNDAQGWGSLFTYYKRYAYTSILGIVADEDDDGNTASGNKYERPESKPPVPKPTPAPAKEPDKPASRAKLPDPAPAQQASTDTSVPTVDNFEEWITGLAAKEGTTKQSFMSEVNKFLISVQKTHPEFRQAKINKVTEVVKTIA